MSNQAGGYHAPHLPDLTVLESILKNGGKITGESTGIGIFWDKYGNVAYDKYIVHAPDFRIIYYAGDDIQKAYRIYVEKEAE